MTKLTPIRNTAITNEEIEMNIELWRGLLGLQHWRFEISHRQPAEGHLMECAINRNRRIANLRIADHARTQTHEEFYKNLIHEMIHPILDPLREEVDFQLLYSDRKTEYKARHDREVERAVEHLAQVLYNLASNAK